MPAHVQLCPLVPSLCHPTKILAASSPVPHSSSRTFHAYAPGTYESPVMYVPAAILDLSK